MGKMRETAEFIRYAVDPRKAKAAVLATELVITTMIVGCRSQLVRANLPEWCAEKITTMRQLDTVMAV